MERSQKERKVRKVMSLISKKTIAEVRTIGKVKKGRLKVKKERMQLISKKRLSQHQNLRNTLNNHTVKMILERECQARNTKKLKGLKT